MFVCRNGGQKIGSVGRIFYFFIFIFFISHMDEFHAVLL